MLNMFAPTSTFESALTTSCWAAASVLFFLLADGSELFYGLSAISSFIAGMLVIATMVIKFEKD